jgi:hypothetical protein
VKLTLMTPMKFLVRFISGLWSKDKLQPLTLERSCIWFVPAI